MEEVEGVGEGPIATFNESFVNEDEDCVDLPKQQNVFKASIHPQKFMVRI